VASAGYWADHVIRAAGCGWLTLSRAPRRRAADAHDAVHVALAPFAQRQQRVGARRRRRTARIEQLAARGRLIAPVLEDTRQRLTLLEKTADGLRRTILSDVLYVSLRGRYGAGSDPHA
jgi:hypothetical protein